MNQHLTVKELPDSEKPYEKCLQYGAECLSDAELLAVIIRTGTAGKKSIEVAQDILNRNQRNLLNLHHLSMKDFMEIPGIGTVKAIQLKCLAEITKRMTKATRIREVSLNNASSVALYYMEELRHENREKLMLCMFDSQSVLLGDEMISVGTVNASLVSPREIFIRALMRQAVHIILLHNHPSGVPLPSTQDKLVTRKIQECGEMLGIHLSDHIIIGDNQYFSFKEENLLY
ncbi:MAG: DNA repair protein RadC [Eubacterium sp.]|jgi:DNA repair protein RadC|nr:DNA repair protein RadC [Eubacterium sp.]